MTEQQHAGGHPPGAGEYDNYVGWKNWTRPFTFASEDEEYFAGETRDLTIGGGDVLEIGYGQGSFLAWARSRNARIAGVEIIAELVAAAQAEGVALLSPDIESIAEANAGRFDTIVAFDVFEHFPIDLVQRRIGACLTMLKPGGKLLLRFPNAQSPFGLAPQFGDPTHKSALSHSVIEHLTQSMNVEIVRYAASFRIRGRRFKWLVRSLRYVARDLIQASLNAIYCQSIPLDPVVVIVLRKPPRAAGSGGR